MKYLGFKGNNIKEKTQKRKTIHQFSMYLHSSQEATLLFNNTAVMQKTGDFQSNIKEKANTGRELKLTKLNETHQLCIDKL